MIFNLINIIINYYFFIKIDFYLIIFLGKIRINKGSERFTLYK